MIKKLILLVCLAASAITLQSCCFGMGPIHRPTAGEVHDHSHHEHTHEH